MNHMPLESSDRQYLRAAQGYLQLGMYSEAAAELEKIDPVCLAVPEVLAVPTIRLRRAAKMGNDANGSKTVEQAQPEEYPVGDFTRLRDAQGGIN